MTSRSPQSPITPFSVRLGISMRFYITLVNMPNRRHNLGMLPKGTRAAFSLIYRSHPRGDTLYAAVICVVCHLTSIANVIHCDIDATMPDPLPFRTCWKLPALNLVACVRIKGCFPPFLSFNPLDILRWLVLTEPTSRRLLTTFQQ